MAANYYSIQVTYDPSTNGWEMFGRDDGVSAFTDPLTGSLTAVGTATDTMFTGSTMTNLGALWNYNTAANQTAQFDNLVVSVVPEPTSVMLGGVGLAGLVALARVRRKQS